MLGQIKRTDVTEKVKQIISDAVNKIKLEIDRKQTPVSDRKSLVWLEELEILSADKIHYTDKKLEVINITTNITDADFNNRQTLISAVYSFKQANIDALLEHLFSVPSNNTAYIFTTRTNNETADRDLQLGRFGVVYIPITGQIYPTFVCPYCDYFGFAIRNVELTTPGLLQFDCIQDIAIHGTDTKLIRKVDAGQGHRTVRVCLEVMHDTIECLYCHRTYKAKSAVWHNITAQRLFEDYKLFDLLVERSLFFDQDSEELVAEHSFWF